MYNAFFDFQETPFAARPNLAFFYRSKQHDAAHRSLAFAVQARMGLSSLTGDEGTGKTTVLDCLRDSLEAVQIQCALVRDSRISTNQLFETIASELDLRCQGGSADQVSSALHKFALQQAKKGRAIALLVDQAHQLPTEVLDQILYLTSQHDNKAKLLQTVLAGRPELNYTLDALNLEPLKQHSILNCSLEPFTAQEAQDYIEFRLAQAGMPEQTFFSPGAFASIYDRSRGVPSMINSLCDGLLRAAFSVGSRACTQEILDQVFRAPREERSGQAQMPAAPTEFVPADLSRLTSGSDPDGPAMHFTGQRLIVDIAPRGSLQTGSGHSEHLRRDPAPGPVLPTSDSELSGAEFTAGFSKLMQLVNRNEPALLVPSAACLVETIDFPGMAVRPPASGLQPAGDPKHSCVPVLPFEMPRCDAPSPGIGGDASWQIGNRTMPAIAGVLTVSSEFGVCEPTSLLPLLCSVSPVPPAGAAPVKPRLTIVQSLQPQGPESKLTPVSSRGHSLLQPAWTARDTDPMEVASAPRRRSFSFNRTWLVGAALAALATLGVYTASPLAISAGGSLKHGWQQVHQAVADRAAVALDEDFRSGLDNWTNRGTGHPSWTADKAGFVHPTSLALFRPSLGLVDYQMQFVGTIDKKGLSWAVRAADFNNYYAVALTVLKPGPTPTIGLTRYAVINGKIQDRVTTPLLMSARSDTVYRVRLDVHGDNFAVSIQDQPVDSWSDHKLRLGGIGFFSEPEARSRVAGVQVRGQYDMLGRLCAFLAPPTVASYQASLQASFQERTPAN